MARPRLKIGERGEVALRQQPNGRWKARVMVRDSDGQIREVTANGPSRSAARRGLERRLDERTSAVPLAANRSTEIRPDMTVAALAAYWLQHRAKHGKARGKGPLAVQTLSAYDEAIRSLIVPHLGGIRLEELRVDLLDDAFGRIESGSDGGRSRDHGTPGRSTAQARSALKQMLDLALRYGAIASNPMQIVESTSRPARDGREIDFLPVVSALRLRRMVRRDTVRVAGRRGPNPDLEEWVDLVLGTGCRIGEALALRWIDLDLESATPTAHIRGTIVEPRRDYVPALHRQSMTKSRTDRILILPGHVVNVLQDRSERVGGGDPEDPVFATGRGNWVSPANIRTRLRKAVAADDELRGTTPHTLRRTVGTLIAHEVGLDAARDQLGHSDPSVTFQHYVGRRTVAPDLRTVLDAFFMGPSPSVSRSASAMRRTAPDPPDPGLTL